MTTVRALTYEAEAGLIAYAIHPADWAERAKDRDMTPDQVRFDRRRADDKTSRWSPILPPRPCLAIGVRARFAWELGRARSEA